MQSQTFVFPSRDGSVGGALQRPRLKDKPRPAWYGGRKRSGRAKISFSALFHRLTAQLFLPLVALHRQSLGSDSESLSLASAVLMYRGGLPRPDWTCAVRRGNKVIYPGIQGACIPRYYFPWARTYAHTQASPLPLHSHLGAMTMANLGPHRAADAVPSHSRSDGIQRSIIRRRMTMKVRGYFMYVPWSGGNHQMGETSLKKIYIARLDCLSQGNERIAYWRRCRTNHKGDS